MADKLLAQPASFIDVLASRLSGVPDSPIASGE